MRRLYTEIHIKAPIARVWDILTQIENYPTWNPFITEVSGPIAEGKKFQIVIRLPNVMATKYRIQTLRLVPQKEWVWLGHFMNIPGIIDGEHHFQLIDQGDGTTRLIQKEQFDGFLVGPLWRWYIWDQITKGSEMMNHALKVMAEGTDGPSPAQNSQMDFSKRSGPSHWKGQWALVTGASSGIGREFCFQLAQAGMNLVMVARQEKALHPLAEELGSKYAIQSRVVSHDLSQPGAAAKIKELLSREGIRIRALIHMAGMDYWGYFEETPVETHLEILQVHVGATLELCHVFQPVLASHLTSAVVLAVSQAAYQPLPYLAVYGAAKSFVLSFGQALYGEWYRQGIFVQSLVAAPTNTNILNLRELRKRGLFKKVQSPEKVVRESLRRLGQSIPVVKAGRRPLFHILFNKLFTTSFVILGLAIKFRPAHTDVSDRRHW